MDGGPVDEDLRCLHCGTVVPFDDAEVRLPHGGIVCVRCYRRVTETESRMSRRLRMDTQDACNRETPR